MSAAENHELKKVLREHELKATSQRIALLKLLDGTHKHLDAEEIYLELKERQKNVSRATVYRSLETLVEQEMVTKLDFGDGRMRYERNKDEDEHHDHLINIRSGEVVEFRNEEIEALQRRIAEQMGFELADHRLELYCVPKKDSK